MDKDRYDPNDPDRNLKRLNYVVGVTSRIKKIALTRRYSASKISQEQKEAETIVSYQFDFARSFRRTNSKNLEKLRQILRKY